MKSVDNFWAAARPVDRAAHRRQHVDMSNLFTRLLSALIRDAFTDTPPKQTDGQSQPSPRPIPTTRPPARTTEIHEVAASVALRNARYEPQRDGDADPGEVVWTWIPFEEDATRGKDRPVVVLSRSGSGFHVVQMTSKDHDRDAEREAKYGRYWLDIGAGEWDPKRRPSEVRLDRILWVPGNQVRREGAILPRALFDRIVEAVRTCPAR